MEDKLIQIDNILQKEIGTSKTPCVSYYLFNTDTILKEVHLGFADLKEKRKADENTFYKAFSSTKTFTALAVLQLAEQKKIHLKDPIVKYLPNFIYGTTITIEQVLSHSAGLPNPIPLSWIHTIEEHDDFDRDVFFDGVMKKNSKAKGQPNQKFAYSNIGYYVLGQLIEEVSGLTYESYIQKNIIEKIKLDNTSIDFKINSQHAVGYNKKASFANLFIGWFVDKSIYMQPSIGKWKPYSFFYPNGASYAGLIGTPVAFVRYLQALLQENSVLISSEFKKIMFTENITNNGKQSGMCLGWFTDTLNGKRYFAHPGGAGGYYCELRIYPEEGIGSVVFFNRTGMSNARFLDKTDKFYFESLAGK